MGKNKKTLTTMSLEEAEQFFKNHDSKNNSTIKEFEQKTTALTDKQRDALMNTAYLLKDSRDYVSNFENSGNVYLTEFLRYGYIGKVSYDMNGTEYVQTSRSKPYGCLVSIYNKNSDKVYVGYSIIHDDEMYTHPMIGRALALKKAVENMQDGIDADMLINNSYNDTNTRNVFMDGNTKEQLVHFRDRSYRFFNPETYGIKGKTPLKSSFFGRIKAVQLAIKCLNTTSNTDFGKFMSDFRKICKDINKNLK